MSFKTLIEKSQEYEILGSCHTLDTASSEISQILDWTENRIYYKTTIIKWRGSSVG